MKKINTILFDLDGTLVDSNELILESFRQTLNHYCNRSEFTRVELIEMMGPPLYDTFKQYTSDESKIQEMIQYYRNTYIRLEFDYVKPYPYTIEMLSHFKSLGYNLAIVTTKFLVSALPSIQTFHIEDYIDTIISLDDVTYHKPHPEPIYKALSAFNNVEGAIMVGDAPSDLLSGQNAGIYSCGIEWSLKSDKLKEVHPTYWIKDFKEFIELIEKHNQEAN